MSAGPNERRLVDGCYQASPDKIADATLAVSSGRSALALLGEELQRLQPVIANLWRDATGELAQQATNTLVGAIEDKFERLRKAVDSLDVVLQAVGTARLAVVNAPSVPPAPSGSPPTADPSISPTDFLENLRLYSRAVMAHQNAVNAREAVMAAAYQDFQTSLFQAADKLAASLGLPIVPVPADTSGGGSGMPSGNGAPAGGVHAPSLPPAVHVPAVAPPPALPPTVVTPPVIVPPTIHPPYLPPVDPPVTVTPPTVHPPTIHPPTPPPVVTLVDPPKPPNWPVVPPVDPPSTGLPGLPPVTLPPVTDTGGGGINTGLVVGGALGVVGGAGAIIGMRNLAGGSAGNAIANAAGRFGAMVRGGGASPAGGAVRGGSAGGAGGRAGAAPARPGAGAAGGKSGSGTAARSGAASRATAAAGKATTSRAAGAASGRVTGGAGRGSLAVGRATGANGANAAIGRGAGANGANGRGAGATSTNSRAAGSTGRAAGAGSRAGGPGARGAAAGGRSAGAGGRSAGALGSRTDGRRQNEDERDLDTLSLTSEDEWLDEADPGRGVVG